MTSSQHSPNPDRGEASDAPLVSGHKRRRSTPVRAACAECRRLKLKCSAEFPCSNCKKRNCSEICPEGSLATGQARKNAFSIFNTVEDLRIKNSELSKRIRELEAALNQARSINAVESHPLLQQGNVPTHFEPRRRNETSSNEEIEDTADEIGSLSISPDGRSTFFGQTASPWFLIQSQEDSNVPDEALETKSPSMPCDVPWLSHAFPFHSNVGKTASALKESIKSFLPSAAEVRNAANIYYRNVAWQAVPIVETDFYETVFRRIYDPTCTPTDEIIESHNLAVLYMVLSMGTLLDPQKPSRSEEASQYYQLGRAALSLDSPLEAQSITVVQALLLSLICHYLLFAETEGSRWVLMGLVVKLCLRIGLHRDSLKFNLCQEETKRRRQLMWEVYTHDLWQCITYGRPPSFSLQHIDAQLPYPTTRDEEGRVEMCFLGWKHRFSLQCLSVVYDQALCARTPNYKTIMLLDKRVRDFYVPPSLLLPGFGGMPIGDKVEHSTIERTIERFNVFAIKEMTIFHIHRGYFAKALEICPDDPLASKYAPSVLAVYDAACTFIGMVESCYAQLPTSTARVWFWFAHTFACALVLGSIADKKRLALAPSALSSLEAACRLFEQESNNTRVAKVLPVLHRVRQQAQSSFNGRVHLEPPRAVEGNSPDSIHTPVSVPCTPLPPTTNHDCAPIFEFQPPALSFTAHASAIDPWSLQSIPDVSQPTSENYIQRLDYVSPTFADVSSFSQIPQGQVPMPYGDPRSCHHYHPMDAVNEDANEKIASVDPGTSWQIFMEQFMAP